MARKTELVTIPLEGRDKGKCFLITEMSAAAGERWATRALLMLGRSGIYVPEELQGAGMAVLARYGVSALLRVNYEDAEPLLAEMMRCVRFVPNQRKPEFSRDLVVTQDGEGDDVEEVATLLYLRAKVFELHTGFSLADALSPMGAPAESTGNPNPTPTSPPASASQYQVG